jgi:uncharacterized protein (DUF2384 family)
MPAAVHGLRGRKVRNVAIKGGSETTVRPWPYTGATITTNVYSMYQQSTMSPALLTKALLRSAEQLNLSAELSQLLQIAADEAARLQQGSRLLDPEKHEWDNALKIVGLFRTLIELLGTSERARTWLGTPNDTLGAKPVDLIRTPDAEFVYRYLSSVRKHELRMPPASRREHRDELQ